MRFRDQVDPMRAEGTTLQNSTQRQARATQHAVCLESLEGVVRAGRVKPTRCDATSAQALISAYQGYECARRPRERVARSMALAEMVMEFVIGEISCLVSTPDQVITREWRGE